MGAGASRRDEFASSVKPELLLSELYGEVRGDDFYAQSYYILEDFVVDESAISSFSPNDAIDIEDAYLMMNPGPMALEHGFVRRNDGTCYIAVHTDLGQIVSGEMFDWWFRSCDNTEKFRWWHPKDHKSGTWDPQFYAVMPHEREQGHYVDHTHITEEKFGPGDAFKKVQIEFLRPSKHFDVTQFASAGITACIVGRIHIRDPSLGWIAIGHVIHMVRKKDNGNSELRSRFWLGDIAYPETPENLLYARMVNYFANSYVSRVMRVPYEMMKGLWVHTAEEMRILQEILPQVYRSVRASDPFVVDSLAEQEAEKRGTQLVLNPHDISLQDVQQGSGR